MADFNDAEDTDGAAIFQELMRIFGTGESAAMRAFVLLPLVDQAEALEFLRSVPTGIHIDRLAELAAAFRAARPIPRRGVEDEGPDAPV